MDHPAWGEMDHCPSRPKGVHLAPYIYSCQNLTEYIHFHKLIVHINFPLGMESKCCMCKPLSVRLCAHACDITYFQQFFFQIQQIIFK